LTLDRPEEHIFAVSISQIHICTCIQQQPENAFPLTSKSNYQGSVSLAASGRIHQDFVLRIVCQEPSQFLKTIQSRVMEDRHGMGVMNPCIDRFGFGQKFHRQPLIPISMSDNLEKLASIQ
jgi:hypothetical protein